MCPSYRETGKNVLVAQQSKITELEAPERGEGEPGEVGLTITEMTF